jgi:hypothetical protein
LGLGIVILFIAGVGFAAVAVPSILSKTGATAPDADMVTVVSLVSGIAAAIYDLGAVCAVRRVGC